MTKKQRQTIFDKYEGQCAYCGCELKPGWHVDHLKPIRRHLRKEGCRYPQRNCVENCMPACASCNINKHSMNLEDFRNLIGGFITSLNRDSTQYKIAKRYGFVIEVEKPVVFYFETVENKEGAKKWLSNSHPSETLNDNKASSHLADSAVPANSA